jgi:hypothetical protein
MDDATHRIKKLERDKARRMGKDVDADGKGGAKDKLKSNVTKVSNVLKMKAAMEKTASDKSKTGSKTSSKTSSKTTSGSKTGSGKMGLAAAAFGGSGGSKKNLLSGSNKTSSKSNATSPPEETPEKAQKPGLSSLSAMRAKLKVCVAVCNSVEECVLAPLLPCSPALPLSRSPALPLSRSPALPLSRSPALPPSYYACLLLLVVLVAVDQLLVTRCLAFVYHFCLLPASVYTPTAGTRGREAEGKDSKWFFRRQQEEWKQQEQQQAQWPLPLQQQVEQE